MRPTNEPAALPRRQPTVADHRGRPDVKALARALEEAIRGEVRFDPGSRALYATDGSNYRQVPIGVVCPKSKADIEAVHRVCRQFRVPLLSRGGGTSLAGQCCNVAVVMDHSKYFNRLLEIDPQRKLARVEPGIVLDDLRNAATKRYGLTFGPDPSTHSRCTLGGMIGNNSCGTHAQMAGRTVDNVEALEILTYDGLRLRVGRSTEEQLRALVERPGREGEIYRRLLALRDRYAQLIRERYPDIPRRVSGYSLDELLPENGFNVARALVGSEGTCVTILEATLRLVENPTKRTLVVLGYPSIYEAADHVPDILPFKPIALEAIDQHLLDGMRKKRLDMDDLTLLPEGRGFLLVEFGAKTREDADAQAEKLMAVLKARHDAPTMSLFDDPHQEQLLWKVREDGLGATARIPGDPDTWEGWEDSAVPPERMGDYLREFRKLLDEFKYDTALYGHFGQGCLHCRINFHLNSPEGVAQYRRFVERAAEIVVRFGGSLSGEHGDGQSRGELLPKMYGEELIAAFREFKAIWDPDGQMNPHKKAVDPDKLDEHLRLSNWHPPHEHTHFKFPEDNGQFSRATTRCVGVGACRQKGEGVMCPSYQATREEKHSTRGRAHLLFEMLKGAPLEKGWRSEAVKESLDLCLACKGCVSDCPVNVDMATYKAEFLSHYYEGRVRPRSAYAFGLIMYWSQLAGRIPELANALTQLPGLSAVAKRLAGVHPHRVVPRYARASLQKLARRRTPKFGAPRGEVVLFPDTFNNFFHSDVGLAALEVMEDAGFEVHVPQGFFCCGRPLYDYGMLDLAKHRLRSTMDQLEGPLSRGAAVVVLEPSCASTFRHELLQLFPDDPRALRLSRATLTVSELFEQRAKDYQPPRYEGQALMHPHCHHHAVLDLRTEKKWLERFGVHAEESGAGCCGMAGAFGFEKEHYEVSQAVAEQRLLPKLRPLPKDALVIANGFSCHEQVTQNTPLRPRHFAQVAHRVIHGTQALDTTWQTQSARVQRARLATWTAAALGALTLFTLSRRRRR